MSLTPGSCSPFKLRFGKGKRPARDGDDDDGDGDEEVVVRVHMCAHCGGRGRWLRGGRSVCRDCGCGRAATV